MADSPGFHRYQVIAKTAESEVITSFSLAPLDTPAAPAYRPGQYLVFRLDVNGDTVSRNYSVSGDPADPDRLRIAVKREAAPPALPDVPPGLGSNHLHDQVHVGDILTAAGPLGQFILDEGTERPVVLMSGGVGLTPLMCMLHHLANTSTRRVFFIHACENGRVHAFADEVRALAGQRPGITAHFCYRNPDPADLAAGRCHSQGLLDRDTLQGLLPLDDYDFYLCGPGGFMQANWRLLRSLGVPKARIRHEFFGPATVLEESQADTTAAKPMDSAPAAAAGVAVATAPGTAEVRFMPSGIAVPWTDDAESLLDLAEQAGLSPAFSCRAGICSTCLSTLVSGQVDYFETPMDEPPEGKVLICCSRPVGPVVIELSA